MQRLLPSSPEVPRGGRISARDVVSVLPTLGHFLTPLDSATGAPPSRPRPTDRRGELTL